MSKLIILKYKNRCRVLKVDVFENVLECAQNDKNPLYNFIINPIIIA